MSVNLEKKQIKKDDEDYLDVKNMVQDHIKFLNCNDFPYISRLIDSNTDRCIACDQIAQEGCMECKFRFENVPLLWDVKNPKNFKIFIDWQDPLAFNPFSIVPNHHQSYIDLKRQKNEVAGHISIQQCLDIYSKEENVELDCDCCKCKQKQTIKTKIQQLPNILIVL